MLNKTEGSFDIHLNKSLSRWMRTKTQRFLIPPHVPLLIQLIKSLLSLLDDPCFLFWEWILGKIPVTIGSLTKWFHNNTISGCCFLIIVGFKKQWVLQTSFQKHLYNKYSVIILNTWNHSKYSYEHLYILKYVWEYELRSTILD